MIRCQIKLFGNILIGVGFVAMLLCAGVSRGEDETSELTIIGETILRVDAIQESDFSSILVPTNSDFWEPNWDQVRLPGGQLAAHIRSKNWPTAEKIFGPENAYVIQYIGYIPPGTDERHVFLSLICSRYLGEESNWLTKPIELLDARTCFLAFAFNFSSNKFVD